jgi:hypothetical protein
MTDALAVAGRARPAPDVEFGTTWWQPRLPVGFPFVINFGLWPSVPILVGNATLVVSENVYV